MTLSYNLDYDIAALVLMIVEMIYLRLQYAHAKYSNRLFIMLLHSSVFLAVIDIVASLFQTTYAAIIPMELNRFALAMYFITNAFIFLVFYRYVVEYLGDKQERNVAYYVRTYFPFVFTAECLFANRYANILFSGGKFGHISYGYLIVLMYIYPVYYDILTLIVLHRNRKHINAKQRISVVSYILIGLMAIVLQYFNASIAVLSFGYAIALLIMLFSLETPDYKRLVETTETLESVREDIDKQAEYNRSLIFDFSKDICDPLEKILECTATSSPNLSGMDKPAYIDGYIKLVRSVVNNALEFYSSGTSKRNLEAITYSVKNLVDEVRSIMLPTVSDKSNSLNFSINSGTPELVVGYEPIIKQILINLINDANKYTKDGNITVTIHSRRVSHSGINLVITVEDTGIGMKRDMVKSLLRFNTKGKSWKKEIFDGGNFKARITKILIEELGGKLHIDSVYGQGSVFTAIIPHKNV